MPRNETLPEIAIVAPPKTPLLTVDCVVLNPRGEVLLIERKNEPFKGQFALPGGFVDIGETVEEACRRELLEETGVKAGRLALVGVYSDPDRDPRGHTASVVFMTRVRSSKIEAGDDAASACWVANWRRLPLAFDHAKILADAMRMAKC